MPIRVIIVDDSALARRALRRSLGRDDDVQVIGEASGGDQAVRLIERRRPDLVTMDLVLGEDDGIEVTATVMRRCPVPIVIVTARDPAEPGLIYEALQAGALEVCAKLPAEGDRDYEASRQRLVRIVKALAKVPVVHRFRRRHLAPVVRSAEPVTERQVSSVLIGASTGGPPVVAAMLAELARPYPVPIVIAQHLAAGFSRSFVDWLVETTRQCVCLADRPMRAAPGVVYLAPAESHLAFCAGRTITPVDRETGGFHRPSIDLLFESAAREVGPDAAGVILTGMGDDGARGMVALRAAGAVTIAQDPATCVVGSMPERAIALGGVDVVLAPEQIAALLRTIGKRAA